MNQDDQKLEDDVINRELADLYMAVDKFAEAMKAKLATKARQGWTGWRSRAFESLIVSRLVSKSNLVEFDRKQAVDIANLSMMLWYQAEYSNKGDRSDDTNTRN